MPSIHIQTNLSKAAIPDGFLKQIADELANLLGKPPSVMMAILDTDKSILFGGDDSPAVMAEVDGIELAQEVVPEISDYIFGRVESELGILPGRVFIKFRDVPRGYWAGMGKVF